MIDANDAAQMIRLFGVDFNESERGPDLLFTSYMFGVKVVFCENKDKYLNEFKDWRVVLISATDDLKVKQKEVLWEMCEAGYIHYMRNNYPSTFKKMLTFLNIDREIINKRLSIYGDKPKYKYLRIINEQALKQSTSYVLSIEPGFFDIL